MIDRIEMDFRHADKSDASTVASGTSSDEEAAAGAGGSSAQPESGASPERKI